MWLIQRMQSQEMGKVTVLEQELEQELVLELALKR
jgi:hypothetical protein